MGLERPDLHREGHRFDSDILHNLSPIIYGILFYNERDLFRQKSSLTFWKKITKEITSKTIIKQKQ